MFIIKKSAYNIQDISNVKFIKKFNVIQVIDNLNVYVKLKRVLGLKEIGDRVPPFF